MAKGALNSGWSTRMVVMTSVVALTLTAMLLFMYPKVLQILGLKAPQQPIAEEFETEVADAEADDGDEEGDGEGEDDEDDEADDEDEEEEDEEDEDEDDTDDDDVSIGTDSNVEVAPDGSKEGFSLMKRAPPPEETATPGVPGKRLVVIHASWCGHCMTLLSSSGPWKKVKKALPGVTIDELDESEHPELVKSLGVQSFPTIMILDSVNQDAIPYDGPRTKDAIVDFALRNIKPADV